mmetsp:Transcript_14937/g.30736  ORF Transcript_14937/g.30736 Transcript_14937/m.30736 type:complete len:199 (-) Transcript_14937:16-612(-)
MAWLGSLGRSLSDHLPKLLSTGVFFLQLRHPQEVGGALLLVSMVYTLVASVVAASIYDPKHVTWSAEAIKISVAVGCTGFICTFGIFLYSIKPQFRSSFYSLKTGNEHVMDIFRLNTEDELRLNILHTNKYKWEPIKEEVLDWLTEKLPMWLETQPDWFDNYFKATIEDWMVKDKTLLNEIRNEAVEAIIESYKSGRF